jgi:hypothetical protein
MPRTAITFETAFDIGLGLPNVERTIAWRSPALKVRGNLMAVVPTHKSAEADSLAVCIPFAQRDELIAAEPDVYYVKPHYENYAVVLVRLKRIHLDALRDLLLMAWKAASAKRPARKRPAKRDSSRTSPLRKRPRRVRQS